MSTFLGKNVLVTGAAGGLGRLLVHKTAQQGATTIVAWDLDRGGLSDLETSLAPTESNLYPCRIDLTEPEAIMTTAKRVRSEVGPVDILINNAGMVLGTEFAQCDHGEIRRLIDCNVGGVLHTTRAFLPDMIERGEGHIVTISSASALLGNPRMSVYAGSKWAVSGWSESLRLELQETCPGIRVTLVQPSYINTGMFEGVTPPLLTPMLEPEYIADRIVRAVRRNKTVLRAPFTVKLLPFLKGILPQKAFDFIAGRLFGVYRSMNTYTGRTEGERS